VGALGELGLPPGGVRLPDAEVARVAWCAGAGRVGAGAGCPLAGAGRPRPAAHRRPAEPAERPERPVDEATAGPWTLAYTATATSSGSHDSAFSSSSDARFTPATPPSSLVRRFLRAGPRPGMSSSTDLVIRLPRSCRW